MKLHSLKPAEGSVKQRKRVGRGQGSTRGGTSTRGHKGAQSRSGYSQKRGFEGGQMPIQRRVPKRGFNNYTRVAYVGLNLDTVQELAEKYKLSTFSVEALRENNIIKKTDLVKILGRGELSSAINCQVNAYSKSAKEAIEKAGGKAELI